ncbi:MAG: hypothetical protein QM710_07155 [Flavobacterium sp.]
MKLLKFIPCLIAALILGSCSSSDSDGGGSSSNSFTYNYDGHSVNLNAILAQKSENTLVVSGTASNGEAIEFVFNKFGNLGTVSSFSVSDFDFPDSQNYMNYSSHYFTFNLVSIDEANKKVHVTFSGDLHEDAYDLDSPTHTVSGEFNVTYTEVTPAVAGLETYCKIGGNDWYSTNSATTNGTTMDYFVLDESNDGANSIYLSFDSFNNGPGTYTFTNTTNTTYARLVKFDPATVSFKQYKCAGTMTVTSKTSAGFVGYYIEGTYSFTATNPSNSADVIQVTNGRFKSYYSW